jgi:hypothetical protein
MTAEEAVRSIAHKFHIQNAQKYGLFEVSTALCGFVSLMFA